LVLPNALLLAFAAEGGGGDEQEVDESMTVERRAMKTIFSCMPLISLPDPDSASR
jgi:hypothetical protein